MVDETRSLWEIYDSEVPPWRRGRFFLIIFAALSVLNQILVFAALILGGYIEQILILGIGAGIFWLAFYFIWIGVHWVRWVQGAYSALAGLALFIWGIEGDSGIVLVTGLLLMGIGSYLALAPSIYFFALRQREKRNWLTTLAIAIIFALLLVSLASGVYGLFLYRTHMQEEAREFANAAFYRVFAQHDTYFLLEHATQRALAPPHGREYLTKSLQHATMRAGDVHDIKPADGHVILRCGLPVRLYVDGEMQTEGMCDRGRVVMRIHLGGVPGDWQIDDIAWIVPDPKR